MNRDRHGEQTDLSDFDSTDEERLALLAIGGDHGAFGELFGRHRAHLKQYVDLRLDPRARSRFDASDVVQETQLEAHRRLADFLQRRPFPLRIWLRKLAHERMLNLQKMHVHRQKRSVRREVEWPDQSSILLAERLARVGSTPSQVATERERQKVVADAIQQLPDMDREVLLMHFIEGFSFGEIATALEVSEAAATKRCARALQRLRVQIKQSGWGTAHE